MLDICLYSPARCSAFVRFVLPKATDDQPGYNGVGVPDVGAFEFGELPATIPSPPIAHPATYIASNSFTANWSSVSGATGYRLDVSPNSSFSTYVAGYQNLNVGNTTSRSVTGLNASTTYYYRVRAYNVGGTSGNSNIVNVTTLSATGPPVVITNPATLIASFSATLNGSVDPHGLTTTVYFQYGTTTSYGSTTALPDQDWEHVPEYQCQHQRLNCKHHLPFPDRGHEQRRHSVTAATGLLPRLAPRDLRWL